MADHYEITDVQTGRVIKTFKSRDRAYAYADAADANYGAVRFTVRPVWVD